MVDDNCQLVIEDYPLSFQHVVPTTAGERLIKFMCESVVKHYRTCKFCRSRTAHQKKTAKKRIPLELEENEDYDNVDFFEILEPIFDKSTKEMAGDLVEIIEDIDEFACCYHVDFNVKSYPLKMLSSVLCREICNNLLVLLFRFGR